MKKIFDLPLSVALFFLKLSLLGTVSRSQGNIQAAARRTIAILADCQSYIRSICYMRRDVAPTNAGNDKNKPWEAKAKQPRDRKARQI